MHELVTWLYGLQSHGIKLGLQGIRTLLDRLDHPERGYRVALVGGTNGKGSVAAMIDAVLHAHGVRTGLYTSPHLVRPNERIRIDGSDLSDDELQRELATIRSVCELALRDGALEAHPSFFEVMTAAALLAFRHAAIDVAVLEVGLGGRLDATNATEPSISAIVTIDLDHVAILGGTLSEIASEKAGIARPGCPLVSGVTQPVALETIRSRCAEIGAEFRDARAYPIPADLVLPLAGEHQRANTRVALATCAGLVELKSSLVLRGLSETRWPGRLQQVSGRPALLLDGAHNVAGAEALARYLAAHRARPVLLFGATSEKDPRSLLAPLAPHVVSVVTTRPGVLRAAAAEPLADAARSLGLQAECVPEPAEALARARQLAGERGLVLIAGSLYLVGTVLTILEGTAAAGPVSM